MWFFGTATAVRYWGSPCLFSLIEDVISQSGQFPIKLVSSQVGGQWIIVAPEDGLYLLTIGQQVPETDITNNITPISYYTDNNSSGGAWYFLSCSAGQIILANTYSVATYRYAPSYNFYKIEGSASISMVGGSSSKSGVYSGSISNHAAQILVSHTGGEYENDAPITSTSSTFALYANVYYSGYSVLSTDHIADVFWRFDSDSDYILRYVLSSRGRNQLLLLTFE